MRFPNVRIGTGLDCTAPAAVSSRAQPADLDRIGTGFEAGDQLADAGGNISVSALMLRHLLPVTLAVESCWRH